MESVVKIIITIYTRDIYAYSLVDAWNSAMVRVKVVFPTQRLKNHSNFCDLFSSTYSIYTVLISDFHNAETKLLCVQPNWNVQRCHSSKHPPSSNPWHMLRSDGVPKWQITHWSWIHLNIVSKQQISHTAHEKRHTDCFYCHWVSTDLVDVPAYEQTTAWHRAPAVRAVVRVWYIVKERLRIPSTWLNRF